MTRIKGDSLTLVIDGEEYSSDATSATIENDDSDSGTITFADARKGSKRDYTLNLSLTQDLNPNSLWRKCWDNPGIIVEGRLAIYGNDEQATPEQPHFTFSVKIGDRPTIGGEAAIDGDDYTADVVWKIQGEPVLDDGGNGSGRISSVNPTGRAAGQVVVLSGQRFTGATQVKFGNTNSPSFIVNSDQSISAVIPTGVSGSVNITVVTPSGTSAVSAYTAA